MALVGRDAGVDGWGDEQAWFGRRDEKGLRPGTSFGLFAIVVFLSLSPAILVGKSFTGFRVGFVLLELAFIHLTRNIL